MIFDNINQLHEAKMNNSISPDSFRRVLEGVHYLFLKKAMQNGITNEQIERYTGLVPESDDFFLYNHHGLEASHEALIGNVNKINAYVVSNDNVNTNSFRRVA